MARLNSGLRLVRAIFLLLALAGALIGAFAEAGQQAKRARTPKSADVCSSDLDEARAASHAKIIRENNFGVALMNRQQFEQALGKFQRACILEPHSDIGCVNAGIALLNMQRCDEARQILAKSAERDPRNPRVWFNLGLLEKALGKSDAAIEDFQKVAQLDPYDADTQYFLGLVYSQEHQYDKAIAAFKRAIDLNPFQVSAEFGLAQALQRKNDGTHAKEHFDRFQHLVSEKLGKPVSFIYGEQGKYSLAESMTPAPEPVPPVVSVHFVNVTALSGLPAHASAIGEETRTPANVTARRRKAATEENAPESVLHFLGSGACIIDYDSDGRPDIFLVDGDGKGNAALYKNEGGGRFVNVTRE